MSQGPSDVAPLPFFLGKRLEDLATLSQSRLLRALDVKEISFFFDALDQLAVPPGRDLVTLGEDGPRHVGFLLEGYARLVRGDVQVGRLGAGDHYGERVLLRQQVSPFQVVTETDVRVARLTLGRFESLAQKHPRVALDLVRAIAATATDDVTVLADRLRALVRERSTPRAADVRVRLGREERHVPTGTTIAELWRSRTLPGIAPTVLAAKLDGRPVMLDTRLAADAVVSPIVEGTEGGDDVLTRSVGLAMLDVLAEVRPKARGRVLPPIDGAVVLEIHDENRAQLASDVSMATERRLASPVAFSEELWTIEEARAYFTERGSHDAATLLDNRPQATVTLSRCGQTYALAFGPCVSTTRDIGPLGIAPHPRGLVVDVGRARKAHESDDSLERERSAPRYGSPMAEEHRRWLAAFGAGSVGELTALATSGKIGDLVLAGEAFHEKALGRIADDVARRASAGLRVLRVAGPSSSGKTTFIRRLTVALSLVGLRTVGLSLADHYVAREKTVRDEAGECDFESPLAIDAELFRAQLERLVCGEKLKVARYDFLTGKSLHDGGPEVALGPGDLLLVEGLHALEPQMIPGTFAHESLGIFVHPATTLPMDRLTTLAPTDLRLLRRIVRDRHTRGYRAKETIARWPSVRRGEERHVFARLPFADHVFDTALAYEPCVLKLLAERCLLEVRRDDPGFVEACRLRELLDGYVGLEPGYVPSSSILREFIGHGPK